MRLIILVLISLFIFQACSILNDEEINYEEPNEIPKLINTSHIPLSNDVSVHYYLIQHIKHKQHITITEVSFINNDGLYKKCYIFSNLGHNNMNCD